MRAYLKNGIRDVIALYLFIPNMACSTLLLFQFDVNFIVIWR